MFTIHSVNSEKELIFSSHENEYYWVELKGADISAFTKVWDEGEYLLEGLGHFLNRLAHSSEPWAGEQKWTSLDHEFSLCVTCSKTGQVTFKVEMNKYPGSEECWSVNANIVTEFGQLEKIAKDAELFFTKKPK